MAFPAPPQEEEVPDTAGRRRPPVRRGALTVLLLVIAVACLMVGYTLGSQLGASTASAPQEPPAPAITELQVLLSYGDMGNTPFYFGVGSLVNESPAVVVVQGHWLEFNYTLRNADNIQHSILAVSATSPYVSSITGLPVSVGPGASYTVRFSAMLPDGVTGFSTLQVEIAVG